MDSLIMPKEQKPGWLYAKDDNPIGVEYAVHIETGWVYFADGVRYSPEEIKIIQQWGGPASRDIHIIKKVFNGEIVRYESGSGTNIEGKCNEGGSGNNNAVNQSASAKIPDTNRISPETENGELEIF
jgi:hypothetical protein